MKALSICEPWATLVAIEAKRYETRSWKTDHRGLVAIHASKTFSVEYQAIARSPRFAAALGRIATVRPQYAVTEATGEVRRQSPRAVTFSLGAIIALATIQDVERISNLRRVFGARLDDDELAFGNYQVGRYAWWIANVFRLPTPIRCRGALSLWTVPVDVEAKILDQVRDRSEAVLNLIRSRGLFR